MHRIGCKYRATPSEYSHVRFSPCTPHCLEPRNIPCYPTLPYFHWLYLIPYFSRFSSRTFTASPTELSTWMDYKKIHIINIHWGLRISCSRDEGPSSALKAYSFFLLHYCSYGDNIFSRFNHFPIKEHDEWLGNLRQSSMVFFFEDVGVSCHISLGGESHKCRPVLYLVHKVFSLCSGHEPATRWWWYTPRSFEGRFSTSR